MFFNSDITKTATVQKKLQIYFIIKIIKIMNKILSVACDNFIKTQNDIIR